MRRREDVGDAGRGRGCGRGAVVVAHGLDDVPDAEVGGGGCGFLDSINKLQVELSTTANNSRYGHKYSNERYI